MDSKLIHLNNIAKIILTYVVLTYLFNFSPFLFSLPSVSHEKHEIDMMLQWMAAMSSAGTTLLIPDCELTHIPTSDAFYYKQIFFTFFIPLVVIICILSWSIIKLTCGKCICKFKPNDLKNYTILSIVLICFLCYPMLAKIALSMLKCLKVGDCTDDKCKWYDNRYLMADLEEQCFVGRHKYYVLLLSIPQLVLVVLGLPLLGIIIILKNNHHFERYNFRIRYGLLYLGYRENREWWEGVIVFRKISIVIIGAFGSLIGVDLQAYMALFVIFISIMIHLIGKPFETTKPKGMV